MKKYLYLAVALVAVLFSSCKKDDDASNNGSNSSGSEVCVMYYAAGIDNLDPGQINDILADFKAGSTAKVAMTFQYKFAKSVVNAGKTSGHSVIRFDLQDQGASKGKDLEVPQDNSDFSAFFNNVQKVTDIEKTTEYDMASVANLKDFINWSKQQHPSAQRFILIVGDHGSGWDVVSDGGATTTRCMLQEENTINGNKVTSQLTPAVIKQAVNESELPTMASGKKLSCLFADCCMMAQWENIYEYADFADYFVGSPDETQGMLHVNLISALDNNYLSNPFESLKSIVNYGINTTNAQKSPTSDISYGVYDLSSANMNKLSADIKAFNEAVGTLDATTKSNIGLKLQGVNYPSNLDVEISAEKAQSIKLTEYLTKAGVNAEVYANGKLDKKYMAKVMRWLATNESATYDAWNRENFSMGSYAVIMTSLMKIISDNANNETITNAYNAVMADIKAMAFVTMTNVNNEDVWLWATPSVCFASDDALSDYYTGATQAIVGSKFGQTIGRTWANVLALATKATFTDMYQYGGFRNMDK